MPGAMTAAWAGMGPADEDADGKAERVVVGVGATPGVWDAACSAVCPLALGGIG